MKVSSSWIKEWLGRTMLSDMEIVQALERAGIEVEQFTSSKPLDKKLIVCSVKKVMQHPNADSLKLVDVLTGAGDVRVVCGASNVRVGLKTALAQIGTVLPGGEAISAVKLRGEASEGMLCSERELGIGIDHKGIIELSSDIPDGTPLCDLYPADGVIDVKTAPNRFDVLSVVGLAREVAAMTSAKLKPLDPPPVQASPKGPAVSPKLVAARYMLAHIRVNQAAPSPAWMTARLRAAGVRAISPVVDATNYAMLETGQPVHAFDAAKIKLPLEVRKARSGEKLTTLDGVRRELTPEDLIIADQTGPVGLAGVMGGADTEVDAHTREILLEAAVFDGATLRKTAKRHALRTEASARFERQLPVQLPPVGLARTIELLGQMAGGSLVAASDIQTVQPKTRRVEVNRTWLAGLLGFGITHKEAVAALEKLQIKAESRESGEVIVVREVPWWRPDLNLPEDLAEEIVRVVGYERVPSSLPSWRPQRLVFDRMRGRRRRVRDVLYGAGLFEVMTYSFVSEKQLQDFGLDIRRHLKLKNPLSLEQAYLRSSLLASHLLVLAANRKYAKEVSFYEISKVFVKKGAKDQPDEPEHLAIMVRRDTGAFAVLKGLVEAVAAELNVVVSTEPAEPDSVYAPGRFGMIKLGGKKIGAIGQLHPEQLLKLKIDGEAAYAELDFLPMLEQASAKQFKALGRFPVIRRDVAVLVPVDTTWQQIADGLAPMNMEIQLVGEYHGAELPAGFKGLTLRFVVAKPDRTPTETEAAEAERVLLARLERLVGARPRE